jgi:non-ribosomal peptide synthetase component F
LSVYDIFGSAAAGCAVVYPAPADRKNPTAWPAQMIADGVTVWNSAPALMQLLLDTMEAEGDGTTLPKLRFVMLSGDWIPPSMPDRIRELAPNATVVSLGGATEASIWSIWYEIGVVDPSWTSIPYGAGMANQPWQILEADPATPETPGLQPVPVGVVGELCIGGIGLALGYLGDPEKTNARFITTPGGERLYRTGDLGRWQPDGNIEFLGRMDSQVKIGGYRIELGEVESALGDHPKVKTAVVLALGERNSKYLVAFVQPVGGKEAAPPKAELQDFAGSRLAGYMVPKTFVFLDLFPVTSNGKLDRRALVVPK